MTAEAGHASRPHRDESGFVLVWFAAALLMMLAVAAVAIDLTHAYYVGQNAQNAADAASLSGVVYLPDLPTQARNRARAMAADNGFADGTEGATVTATQLVATNPHQLQVDVKRKFDTFFGRAIGISTLTVHKRAIAEYDPPVSLGSPYNTFGNVPGACGATAAQCKPNIWANVAGGLNGKDNGNAFLANYCGRNNALNTPPGRDDRADDCDPEGTTGNNTDVDPNGQLFEITTEGGSAKIDLYDPAWVNTGANCTDTNPSGRYPPPPQIDPRFVPGNNDFCTGDSSNANQYWNPLLTPPGEGPGNDNDPTKGILQFPGLATGTTYTLYTEELPGGAVANAIPGQEVSGCTRTYPGYVSVSHLLAFGSTQDKAAFHNWTNLCNATGSTTGRYVLKVTTESDKVGSNNFSIDAYASAGALQPDSTVTVSAAEKMALFTNASDNSVFYLARVPSTAARQLLRLDFFDIGDLTDTNPAGPSDGSLKVFPVDSSGVELPGFAATADCQFSDPAQRRSDGTFPIVGNHPPWVPASNPFGTYNDADNCEVDDIQPSTGVVAGPWNGAWSTWTVKIPADWATTCDDADPRSCWFQIQFGFPVTNVKDLTTWAASLSGNAPRLVK